MNARFFQFPLCALRFVAGTGKRLNYIISFACVELGRKQWQKFTAYERQLRRSDSPSRYTCPVTIDMANDEHLQVVAGAERLRITIGNIERLLAEHASLTQFIQACEAKHGKDAQVRLRTDWVFEVRDGKGMSYSELAVLAAIYSTIGISRRPVRITCDHIWKRAHGFKSDFAFKQEMNGQTPFVSRRQVRSIVERLDARNFFARVTYGRRQTYYSHRMTVNELSDAVFRLKTQRNRARRASMIANATLTQRIQAERRRLGTFAEVGGVGAAT